MKILRLLDLGTKSVEYCFEKKLVFILYAEYM